MVRCDRLLACHLEPHPDHGIKEWVALLALLDEELDAFGDACLSVSDHSGQLHRRHVQTRVLALRVHLLAQVLSLLPPRRAECQNRHDEHQP